MAYPFAGFSTFMFARDERAIEETDTRWNYTPSYDTSKPIGGNSDSIVLMAIGSSRRSFICRLYPTRFALLRTFVGTFATFVDWERPDPDERPAFLSNLTETRREDLLCSDGTTVRVILAQVELVST